MAELNFWGNNAALPCSAYDRLAEVDQGAIVENKRLGHVLAAAKLVQDKETTRDRCQYDNAQDTQKGSSQESPNGH